MMVVITVSNCPPSLRGDLSKWCFEIVTGVYVGNPSKRVRELLWDRVKATIKTGNAVIVYSSRNEQGFEMKTYHTTDYPKDFDGLQLMFHPITPIEVITEEIPRIKVPVLTTGQLKDRARKYPSPKHVIPDSFVVLDLETTGLDSEKDGITEVGAIRVVEGKYTEEFSFLVKTSSILSAQAAELTGITVDLLNEQGKDEKDVLENLRRFCNDFPVICHNAKFDLRFLEIACIRHGIPYWAPKVIDTLQLARRHVKDVPNYRLQTLLDYFGISDQQQHRALSDCWITLKMLEKLKEIVGK